MRLSQTLPSTQSDGLSSVGLVILCLFDDGSRDSFCANIRYMLPTWRIVVTNVWYQSKSCCSFSCVAIVLHAWFTERLWYQKIKQTNLTNIACNRSLTSESSVAWLSQSRHECPRNRMYIHVCSKSLKMCCRICCS
jgi:hypothetical protein